MSNKCAIVTGGAGFIGSHVVDALLADGWRVVVIDDLSSGDARRVASEATLEIADITDRGALDTLFDSTRPAAVFHLAAQSSVTQSVADPERDCEINVRGTLNVLESSTRHRAPVVFTSTGGALYGDRAPLPTPEDTPPAPVSPYGASKWAGEAYVATWREASGSPTPSADSATSTGRGRARTGRPVWSRSSATTCGGAIPDSLRLRQTNP